MNLSQGQTGGGKSTELRKMCRELVRSGRDAPFSVSWRPLYRQRVRTQLCVYQFMEET